MNIQSLQILIDELLKLAKESKSDVEKRVISASLNHLIKAKELLRLLQ